MEKEFILVDKVQGFEVEEFIELSEIMANNKLFFVKDNDNVILVCDENDDAPALSFYYNLYDKLSSFPLVKVDSKIIENLIVQQKEQKTNEEEEDIDINNNNNYDFDELLQNNDLLDDSESAPIIKFVNSMFYSAIKQGVSDIHIETKENSGIVRFRINGILKDFKSVEKNIIPTIISRIKVLSHLDISETRLPQDGRTQVVIGKEKLDIRVSTLPTYFGEKIVLRILLGSDDIPNLEELGYEQEDIEKLEKMIGSGYGMILVTGPTGSGKSTTLHAFLKKVYSKEKNITTIEDPIEYKDEKINQIQINTKAGFTFATGLRSILRQDPDIILVGELRDNETVDIAFKAAQTGHLVFSTLHTNTATSTIPRLIDMGVEHYMIKSSLVGVVNQRLYRELCDCKTEEKMEKDEKKLLGLPLNRKYMSCKANGCKKCNNTGYITRKAIGEILELNDEIKTSISKDGIDIENIEKNFKENNKTLEDKLKKLVIDKKTSIEEYIRVIGM